MNSNQCNIKEIYKNNDESNILIIINNNNNIISTPIFNVPTKKIKKDNNNNIGIIYNNKKITKTPIKNVDKKTKIEKATIDFDYDSKKIIIKKKN